MIRLGLVDNCSARRFFLLPPPPGMQITAGQPRAIARLAGEGQVAAALVSVAALAALPDGWQTLPFGIASHGECSSVKLFSAEPLENLLARQQPIAVSEGSLTAARLLEYLCQTQFGSKPVLAGDNTAARAHLLIGDAALTETAPWPCICDLGQWWTDHTGLPMVWAVWMVNRHLPLRSRQAIEDWLGQCLALAATPTGDQQLLALLPATTDAALYPARIYHTLGDTEQQALQRFLAMP